MKARLLTAWIVVALAGLGWGGPEPPLSRASRYSATTLLVCNTEYEGSRELAEYYAKARQIPLSHILELACPVDEEISRAEYERFIEQPLRKELLEQGWWIPQRDAETGEQALQSRFHVLVLMRGMPLKVMDERAELTGDARRQTTAASVDSELTALGRPGSTFEGPLTNPYYESETRFDAAQLAIQLVGRIDGPGDEVCRAMIDGAIAAEVGGLWGQAYVDLDDPHPLGNEWLEAAAKHIGARGIPVTLSRFGETFPQNYPMTDPIIYLGWQSDAVNGPFLNPGFRFRPGAVACHLDSLSGATVRSGEAHWVGPLLERGAGAVLGNVYEPFIQLTHNLDIFMDRLTKGFSFVESAYMATRGLSWMGVALGDPLYEPFRRADAMPEAAQYQKDDMRPYKILRAAYARWGKGEALPDRELFYKLVLASTKLPEPELLEHLALAALEQKDYEEAATQFLRARKAYGERRDQLRMDLHLGDLERRRGDRLDSFKAYRKAALDFGDIPEGRAAEEMMAIVQSEEN